MGRPSHTLLPEEGLESLSLSPVMAWRKWEEGNSTLSSLLERLGGGDFLRKSLRRGGKRQREEGGYSLFTWGYCCYGEEEGSGGWSFTPNSIELFLKQ